MYIAQVGVTVSVLCVLMNVAAGTELWCDGTNVGWADEHACMLF